MWGAFGNTPLDVVPAPPPAPGTPAAPPPPRVTDGPGPPQWGIVHGIRVSNDGLVYVADRGNSRVQVFSLDGKYITQVFINRNDKSAATAAGIALSPDKDQKFLYVSDFGNGHIFIVDRKSLDVVGQFGQQGKEPGNFTNAHHIMTDSKGNIFTTETYEGRRLQKFVYKGIGPVAKEQGVVWPK